MPVISLELFITIDKFHKSHQFQMHRGTYLQIFSIRTTTSSTLLSSKAERRLAALSFNGRGLSTRLTTWCGRSSQWWRGSPRCWWSVAWCSPWLGQAWRQHLHFCPETFLNLPRPLSLYIDNLGKWIQTKSKKTPTFIKTESFFMSLTAAAEDFSRAQLMKRKWRGLLAWGQVERLGLAVSVSAS